MKAIALASLFTVTCILLPLAAQQKSQSTEAGPALEKQLWAIEQQWLQSEHDKKMDFLKDLWTNQFFDLLPGGRHVTKEEMLDLLSKGDPKPGTGAFPDDFRLRAVYGNVALATDHTVIKSLDANGRLVSREIRALRMFVNENGKWKVAGAALVPISQ
jgi:hypothetical protein